MTADPAGLDGPGDEGGVAGTGRICTLHYYPFSLYSIIVRFAIELGRSMKSETSPNVVLRLVNLHEHENLTEDYLTLNAKGQVPALNVGSDVLTESLDILHWLCKIQPELMPDAHQEDIEAQLEAFYTFHSQQLALKPEALSWGIPNKALELLENPELSEAYRRRLEIKSMFHDTTYGGSLNPENVEDVKLQARFFIEAISRLLRRDDRGDGDFIFGQDPSVLDAVATAFLSRLQDMDQTDLAEDDKVWDYQRTMTETEAWRRTMHGRKTVWQTSDGAAEKWHPL